MYYSLRKLVSKIVSDSRMSFFVMTVESYLRRVITKNDMRFENLL